MPTPETIHCVGKSTRNGLSHIVNVTRIRESDGAATQHKHNGLTLCGAIVDSVLPFMPATVNIGTRCQDCLDEFDQRIASATQLIERLTEQQPRCDRGAR